MIKRLGQAGALAAAGVLLALPAAGQDVGAFYQGKTIDVIIGYSAGGTYDATARLLSRHMPRHLAGSPTMVPRNMPGSGSIRAILNLYEAAPRDGTALGMISRSYGIDPIFEPDRARFDPTRLNAIGSTSTEVSVGVVWHTSPVRTLSDLQSHEIIVGATGVTDDTGRFPAIVKNLTGSKIRIVTGYSGGNDVTMAMERGEVDGRFGWSWGSVKSRSAEWLQNNNIRILVQMGLSKASDLPDTPFIMDFARDEKDRQALELIFAPQAIAWPLVAPPELPADRLAALRASFDRTMTDPAFLEEAERLRIDVEPVSGQAMQDIVTRLGSFDRSVIDHANALTTVN